MTGTRAGTGGFDGGGGGALNSSFALGGKLSFIVILDC